MKSVPLQRRTIERQPVSIGARRSVRSEGGVTIVGASQTATVLDRAPVLFGPRRYLPYVGEETVGVAAEQAIDLFDAVQVRQPVAINRKIIAPPHRPQAPRAKTDRLIQRDPEIEQRERNEQRVNHRRRQQRRDTAAPNVAPQTDRRERVTRR